MYFVIFGGRVRATIIVLKWIRVRVRPKSGMKFGVILAKFLLKS